MARTLSLSADVSHGPRKPMRDTMMLAAVVAGHLLALLIMRDAMRTVIPSPQPPDLMVQLAPPPTVPPAVKPQAHRSGGAPAAVPKRARPSAPRPQPALEPPMKLRPPAPVTPLPLTPPDIIAPTGPELASPVTGAGPSAAAGGEGAGTGTGPGGAGAPRLADPDWLAFPDIDVISAHYPSRAARLGQSGSVTLRCLGDIQGRARQCRVAAESPKGAGFGRAALELSSYFRFRPLRVDGRAVAATLEIPIDFSLAPEPPGV